MGQDLTLLMSSPSSVSSLKLTRKASGAHTCRRLPSIFGTCSQHRRSGLNTSVRSAMSLQLRVLPSHCYAANSRCVP